MIRRYTIKIKWVAIITMGILLAPNGVCRAVKEDFCLKPAAFMERKGAQTKPADADIIAAFNAFQNDDGFVASASNCAVEVISSGWINLTYCVIDKGTGKKYIIQRLNRIFDISAIDNNLQLLEIAQRDPSAKEILPSYWQRARYYNVRGAYGKIYYDTRGGAWRVMDYIDGQIFESSHAIPQKDRRYAARSLGEAIAIFERVLECLPRDMQSSWKEPLPNFHDVKYHYGYLRAVYYGKEAPLSLSFDKSRKVRRRDDVISTYPNSAQRVTALWSAIESRKDLLTGLDHLGYRIAHNDLKINNAIFRRNAAGRLECVSLIDLDTIQRANMLEDLGDALSWAGSPSGANVPSSLDEVAVDTEVINEIIEGYLGKMKEFYGGERAEELRGYALIAYKTFLYELCLRFFADALVGNEYFKFADDIALRRAEVMLRTIEKLEEIESWAGPGAVRLQSLNPGSPEALTSI